METKDQIIDALIEKVQLKKKEIEATNKPNWLTSGLFKRENGPSVNIKVVTDVNELISMMGYIISESNNFEAANIMLETNNKFEFAGYPLESWVNDIKTRINLITINTKKKELALIEEQLDSLISKERKEELLLAKIMKTLERE